jgi:hypothetical protein
MTRAVLSRDDRVRIREAIHRALRQKCPDLFESGAADHAGGLEDLDAHLDDLVAIVQGTTATRIEPYLAQILDEICSKCGHQAPSGYCALRQRELCLLYAQAPAIIRAIASELHLEPEKPR